MVTNEIVGVLLAGGRSKRMGGGDKGLLELADKPMLAHIIDRVAPQAGALIINANGDPARFDQFNLPVVADVIDGHVGPLAGVLTGMRWATKNTPRATHILTAPSDAPLIPTDLAAKLIAALALAGNESKIALAASGGHKHPVAGLWPVNLADDLEVALNAGVRKVLQWTDTHGTAIADFRFIERNGESIDPFFNANTPEDFAQARALIEPKNE